MKLRLGIALLLAFVVGFAAGSALQTHANGLHHEAHARNTRWKSCHRYQARCLVEADVPSLHVLLALEGQTADQEMAEWSAQLLDELADAYLDTDKPIRKASPEFLRLLSSRNST